MLYAATIYERADGRGIIRVAMPLAEVNEALEQLRASLLVAPYWRLHWRLWWADLPHI